MPLPANHTDRTREIITAAYLNSLDVAVNGNTTAVAAAAVSTGFYADAPTGGDDTVKLQSALTAAMAAGKHLFLRPGAYTTTAMLSVDGAGYSGGGFGIVGASDGSTTIWGPAGGSDLPALLKIGVTNFAQRVTLRDFSINYPAGHSHTTGHGILAATHVSVMDRVICNNAPQDAFHISNSFTNTQFLRMTRCEGWTMGRDGLFIANMTDCWVGDCIFTAFGSFASPKGRYGIYSQASAVEFSNNWCYQMGNDGLHADTGIDVHIRGGQYADNNGFGVNVASIDKLNVDHVELFDNAGGCLQLGSCTDIQISHVSTGRVLTSYPLPTNSMYFTNCRYGSVHDNVVDGFATNGIVFQTTNQNINVHDNVVKNGGTTAIFHDGAWMNIHDNIVFLGIFEGTGGNHNHVHDNQTNGAAVTIVGANSLATANW